MSTTVTPEAVEARLTEAIASFGPDPSSVTRDSTFEELDVDSLDLVEFAQIIEDEYGVEVKSEDVKGLKTFGDAVDFVVSRAS